MSDLERNAADELLFATGRLVGEDDQLLQETAERLARGESVDLDALRERPTVSDEELDGLGELAAPLDDAFIGALTRSIASEEDGAASRVPSSAGVAASTSEPAGAQVISLASRRARTGWIAGSLSAAAAAALLWWTGGGVVDGPADAGLYRLELANAPKAVRGRDSAEQPGLPGARLELETDARVQWILRPGQAVSSPVSLTAELLEEGAARELAAPCVSHETSPSGVVRVDLRLDACDWASAAGQRELRLTVSFDDEVTAEPAQAFPVSLTLVKAP